MPYIGRSEKMGVRTVYHYLASNGDTSVSGADADSKSMAFVDGNYIDVYLNGVRLKNGEDYNTTTANTVAGMSALNANDEVNVVVYDAFSVADTVQASTGGTFGGNITASKVLANGDTAAGDDAAMGYTATEGLILTGQGSTNGITIKNDADTAVLTVATGTTNVDIVGDVTAATLNADGDTSAGDNAAIGYTASEGLILTGQGSTDDITIKNDADTTILNVATGGTDIEVSAGNIFFGTASKGIYLGVTSATAANLLDDYEEGTFTPLWKYGGTDNTDSSAGVYTKVGNLVHIGCTMNLDNSESGSGNVTVTGFPFAFVNNANFIQRWKIFGNDYIDIDNLTVSGAANATTLNGYIEADGTGTQLASATASVAHDSNSGKKIHMNFTYFTN